VAQYRKDEVEQAIVDAALREFAFRGYRTATIAGIARAANVSTGNVYRYFEGKDALLRRVVPADFPAGLAALTRRRVKALDGIDDVDALSADAPFRVVAENLLGFCIEHRLQVLVILGRSEGTPFAGFRERLADDLAAWALDWAGTVHKGFRPRPVTRQLLDLVYRSYLSILVDCLSRYEDAETIREAVGAASRYHLAGMRALLV